MTSGENKTAVFVPGSKKNIVPFMRDVFTVPTNSREKPRLIGSVCRECEEYFFPKTGAKATCDNPFCPRSTSETLLSGRGRLLSATVTRSSAAEEERASAVILLEEGIKINSPLVDWEGFRDLLVPGTPVELVLREMGETEGGETIVGYAFRLVTRKKPKLPTAASQGAEPAPERGTPSATRTKPPSRPPSKPPRAARPKAAAQPKPPPRKAANKKVARKNAPTKKKPAPKRKAAPKPKKKAAVKKSAVKKPLARKSAAKKPPPKKLKKKAVKKKATAKKTIKKSTAKKAKKKTAVKKTSKKRSRRTPSKKKR